MKLGAFKNSGLNLGANCLVELVLLTLTVSLFIVENLDDGLWSNSLISCTEAVMPARLRSSRSCFIPSALCCPSRLDQLELSLFGSVLSPLSLNSRGACSPSDLFSSL